MVNMTLAIPEHIYKAMKEHNEIKWTEIARQAITRKISELKRNKRDHDPELREYALRHALEDWSPADELFKY
ncbi:MAG: hypothetical protein ABH821_02655 [archaeon]